MDPINLLIDTCSLIQLINKIEISSKLELLKSWTSKGVVKIYCPKSLKQEWEKHKQEERRKIKMAVDSHVKQIKKANLFGFYQPDDVLGDAAEESLANQLEIIDELLDNGIFIEDDPRAMAISFDHRRNNKAPYLTKMDSDADSMIIFSTLNELEKRKQSSLYFISANHKEFSKGEAAAIIHPDIQNEFLSISIKYFPDLNEAFDHFLGMGLPQLDLKRNQHSERITNDILIDKKASLIDQLVDYLEKRFIAFDYLPKTFWVNHYPFVLGDYVETWQDPFSLNTNNRELYDLFLNVSLVDGRVQLLFDLTEYEQFKLKQIIRRLNIQQIFEIQYFDKKNHRPKKIKIPHLNTEPCDCPSCEYERFNFSKLRKYDVKDLEDKGHLGQMALVNYRVQDYKTAGRLLVRLKTIKPTIISEYLVGFNLIQIEPSLKFYYPKNNEAKDLIRLARSIDLKQIANNAGTGKRILNWIGTFKFLTEVVTKLERYCASIKDLYYTKTSGESKSFNSLLFHYSELVLFVRYNNLMVESDYRFRRATELFIEGVFCSYSSKEKLFGRLSVMTDWILKLLVFFSTGSDIFKYVSRYKVSFLRYDQGNGEGGFPELVANLIEELNNFSRDPNHFTKTWEIHETKFFNSLELLCLLQLKPGQLDYIMKALLNLLKSTNKYRPITLFSTLNKLFVRKSKDISSDIIQEYFIHFVPNSDFHNDNFLYSLSDILRSRNVKTVISQEVFDAVLKLALSGVANGNDMSDRIVLVFLNTATDNHRITISGKVSLFLRAHFDADIFYVSYIFDIISPEDILLLEYEQYLNRILDEKPAKNFEFSYKGYYTDARIDQYINLIFKSGRSIPDNLAAKICKLDLYYSWILDLENFNYQDFNVDWIFNHFTKYYKYQFRQSVSLKKHLLEYLNDNRNNEIANTYIDIYCRER